MKSSTSDGPRFMSSLDDDTLKVTGWREEQLTQTRHIEGMMSMLRKFKKRRKIEIISGRKCSSCMGIKIHSFTERVCIY